MCYNSYILNEEGWHMGIFIQNNIVWLVPIVSIILTIVVKISAKPEFLTLGFIDYLDFGFDLSITSMVMLLTGIKDDAGLWLLLISILLVMITSIIVNRLGWNKETKQQKFLGVFIPDVVGILLLVISTLYIGGVIK